MSKSDLSLWVGGAAGDGIASAGAIFMQLCARSGVHAYAYSCYQSLIRGGHVLYQLAAGPEKRYTQDDDCDILVALNQETLHREAKDASRGVLFNSDRFKLDPSVLRPTAKALGIPCAKISRVPLMQNSIAMGALMKFTGLDFGLLEELLIEKFKNKSAEVAEANITAAKGGFDYAAENFPDLGIRIPGSEKRHMVISGNEAIALGAAAAGCKFFSGYPMTPATTVMHWLAPRAARLGMVLKQAEDEIAAVNMVVGASIAGVRSMTATSGGGFALMTEGISFAAMVEAPVVIVNSQRGGPSTGLPTKTEQADLFQALGAGQGDFPKVVLAPHTVGDAFHSTVEAFNLAEKYQIPVIIMSDLLLSEHSETIEDLDMDVPIERGVWAVPGSNGSNEFFPRFLDTPSGVSPRAVPGHEGLMHVASSDEHDERGNNISDVATDPLKRIRMMDKRKRKLEAAAKDLKPPVLEGPQDAELTLVGWGSTYSMMRRMMRHFNQDGMRRVNLLPIRYLQPFQSAEIAHLLNSAKKVMSIEVNQSGQLARLIRMETGFEIVHRLLKYDGEPFYPGATIRKIEEALHE